MESSKILQELVNMSNSEVFKTLENLSPSALFDLLDFICSIDYNCAKVDFIYQLIDEEFISNIEEYEPINEQLAQNFN